MISPCSFAGRWRVGAVAILTTGHFMIATLPLHGQDEEWDREMAAALSPENEVPEVMPPAAEKRESNSTAWDSSRGLRQGEDVSASVRIEDIVEPPAEYHYAAFGRPDPFQPPSNQITQQMRSGKGELQYGIPVVNSLQVPLDRLTVRGIWQLSNGERRALVIVRPQDLLSGSPRNNVGLAQRSSAAAAGDAEEGIVAKVGDPVGPSGKILEILSDRIVTRQYKLLRDGVRAFDDISLFLGGPEAQQRLEVDKTYVLAPGKDPQLDMRSSSAEFVQKFGASSVRVDAKSNTVITPDANSQQPRRLP